MTWLLQSSSLFEEVFRVTEIWRDGAPSTRPVFSLLRYDVTFDR